jgi:hypothetical protein
MHLKNFLLGGALALAFVSSSRAEDAVVAEDPLQTGNVNVCEAYGTGYALIPGTGTCMKAGGYVRHEKHFSQGAGRRSGSSGQFTLDFETRSD